jgi:hypothetical protein
MGNSVRHYLGYGYGLVQGLRRPDLQYLVASISEAKCTQLVYRTRLSTLHTLNSH